MSLTSLSPDISSSSNLSSSNSITTRHYSSNLSSSNSITTRHYSSKPWYCPRCSFAWYCPRCSFAWYCSRCSFAWYCPHCSFAWYCSRCSFACDFSSRFSLFFWFSSSTQVYASDPKFPPNFRLTSIILCVQ